MTELRYNKGIMRIEFEFLSRKSNMKLKRGHVLTLLRDGAAQGGTPSSILVDRVEHLNSNDSQLVQNDLGPHPIPEKSE